MPRRGSWDWEDFAYFPPPSQPIRTTGGIKAQSQKGGFGRSWWAKRWIAVLEGFGLGARLTRGRTYARNGQVLDITITAGHVTARVQGSRPRPYTVQIAMAHLTASQWEQVVQVIGVEAIFLAQLLNGVMPQEIERVFSIAGLSLFPDTFDALGTSCSCPDWSNPCKHIAAVYYLLGEEFDRDPFLLFALRGMPRDTLLARLAEIQGTLPQEEPAASIPEPLPDDPTRFWGQDRETMPALDIGHMALPPVQAALPKRLGRFPFWRGERDLHEMMEEIYPTASRHALKTIDASR